MRRVGDEADLALPVLLAHPLQCHVADELVGLAQDDGGAQPVSLSVERSRGDLPIEEVPGLVERARLVVEEPRHVLVGLDHVVGIEVSGLERPEQQPLGLDRPVRAPGGVGGHG